MKLKEAMGIIDQKEKGFKRSRGMLASDHFPDKHAG